jgi:hypothetical protein
VHRRKIRFRDETWNTPPDGPAAGEPQLTGLTADIDVDDRHGARVKLFLRDGRLHIGETCFYSRDEDGEIRFRAFRGLREQELKRLAEAWILHRIAKDPPLKGYEVGAIEDAPRQAGQRRRRDRGFIALVAHLYLQRVKVGRSEPQAGRLHPVKDVAAELGYSTAHIRDLVRQARTDGLLTPTTPGKAGGELTPEGRAWLDDYKRRTNPTER